MLQLIARGYLYKEVGLELGISPKTVEHHVSACCDKLQLSNRHQLSRWAAERRRLVGAHRPAGMPVSMSVGCSLRSTLALAAALAGRRRGRAGCAEIPVRRVRRSRARRRSTSFRRAPWRWPTRRISYFNAARANAGAVRAAVRTWNRSGSGCASWRSPRRRAGVVIRYWPQPGVRARRA